MIRSRVVLSENQKFFIFLVFGIWFVLGFHLSRFGFSWWIVLGVFGIVLWFLFFWFC